jgi:hypothetical protein
MEWLYQPKENNPWVGIASIPAKLQQSGCSYSGIGDGRSGEKGTEGAESLQVEVGSARGGTYLAPHAKL